MFETNKKVLKGYTSDKLINMLFSTPLLGYMDFLRYSVPQFQWRHYDHSELFSYRIHVDSLTCVEQASAFQPKKPFHLFLYVVKMLSDKFLCCFCISDLKLVFLGSLFFSFVSVLQGRLAPLFYHCNGPFFYASSWHDIFLRSRSLKLDT